MMAQAKADKIKKKLLKKLLKLREVPKEYQYKLEIEVTSPVFPGGETVSNHLTKLLLGNFVAGVIVKAGCDELPNAILRKLKQMSPVGETEKTDLRIRYKQGEGLTHFVNIYFRDRDLAEANKEDIEQLREASLNYKGSKTSPAFGMAQFFSQGGWMEPKVIVR